MSTEIRLNKYLADKGYATRRGADALIKKGLVKVNGKTAMLGQKVSPMDTIEVRAKQREYKYYVFNKPRGVITHSPQLGEKDVRESAGIPGVFPVGRLDKDSHGLMLLTDDGRVTDRLLNPDSEHDKEYRVTTVQKLRPSFASHMESGVDIGGYETKKCKVKVLGDRSFSITLQEGKKHQIRRMCAALHVDVSDLERTRMMDLTLDGLRPGMHRELTGDELRNFLSQIGLSA